jgi:D-alanine-D-alanine ligase
MSLKNIVVAYGGISPEHEVSVLTAHQAIAALKEAGKAVTPLYVSKNGRWYTGEVLLDLSRYTDLTRLEKEAIPCTIHRNSDGLPVLLQTAKTGLFSKPLEWPVYAMILAFHGADGENGSFQGICESFNIAYTGSGVSGSALGMDKALAKQITRQAGLPVVDWIDFREDEWVSHREKLQKEVLALGYPIFVKPLSLGSSIGITKVSDPALLDDAIELAFRYDGRLIIEKAVEPLLEINCSVMGNATNARASVCEQPRGKNETLSYEDKYLSEPGSTKGMASADRIIPAAISDTLTKEIQDLAIAVFRALRSSGLARLDFLVQPDSGKIYFNEINTIPGSFSFYLWQHSGLSFDKLLDQLLDIALDERRRKNGRIRSYETNLLSKKAASGIKGMKLRK